MFSPSLISMMYQSLATVVSDTKDDAGDGRAHADTYWTVAEMEKLVERFKGESLLPIVGYTLGKYFPAPQWFGDGLITDSFPEDTMNFFWGRIPVARLVRYLLEFRGIPPEQELLDLGAPLRTHGSGSSFDTTCAQLLANTDRAPAVSVAIVDRGESVTGRTPDDYGGKLRHAVTKDVVLDDHAEKVLSVLLERLDHYGILSEVKVSCALVTKPAKPIGRACFRHANTVEMLTALRALRNLTANDNLPLAINLSLGTHVGPHNGDSPLEQWITRWGDPKAHRFFHASAGNDGLSGVAAVKTISGNEPEYFRINLSEGQCADFLVEFWWHDPKSSPVTMDVNAVDPGTGKPLMKLTIDSHTAGRTLKATPVGWSTVISRSLFHARCRNDMSCIAFALSTPPGSVLPALDLRFAVDSSIEIVMHAWIVICDGAQAMFVEGDSSATVAVPASAPGVISVAGVEDQGRPWENSSRGPAAAYQPGVKTHSAPSMAHLVALGALGSKGTSYASPRACADTTDVIRDPARLRRCHSILDVLCESYGLTKSPSMPWSPRTGYKAVIR